MSLILDALNKAQRERQEQQDPVPQLSTVHHTPSRAGSDKPGRYQKGAIAGGVLVLCLAAFFGGRWLSTDAPVKEGAAAGTGLGKPQAVLTERQDRPPQTVAAEESVRVEPARRALVKPAGSASPASPAPEHVTRLYQRPDEPEAVSTVKAGANESANSMAVTRATLSRDTQPAPQRAASKTVAAAALSATPTPRSEESPVPPARESMDSITTLTDIPFVQDLSWATQQNLPSLIYADHRYQESPAARSVVINGNAYRRGGQIGQGIVLEEILRDGIVLQFQGQRFKLQALNSWVNF